MVQAGAGAGGGFWQLTLWSITGPWRRRWLRANGGGGGDEGRRGSGRLVTCIPAVSDAGATQGPRWTGQEWMETRMYGMRYYEAGAVWLADGTICWLYECEARRERGRNREISGGSLRHHAVTGQATCDARRLDLFISSRLLLPRSGCQAAGPSRLAPTSRPLGSRYQVPKHAQRPTSTPRSNQSRSSHVHAAITRPLYGIRLNLLRFRLPSGVTSWGNRGEPSSASRLRVSPGQRPGLVPRRQASTLHHPPKPRILGQQAARGGPCALVYPVANPNETRRND